MNTLFVLTLQWLVQWFLPHPSHCKAHCTVSILEASGTQTCTKHVSEAILNTCKHKNTYAAMCDQTCFPHDLYCMMNGSDYHCAVWECVGWMLWRVRGLVKTPYVLLLHTWSRSCCWAQGLKPRLYLMMTFELVASLIRTTVYVCVCACGVCVCVGGRAKKRERERDRTVWRPLPLPNSSFISYSAIKIQLALLWQALCESSVTLSH